MAQVTNIKIAAQHEHPADMGQQDYWFVTVEYDAVFTSAELKDAKFHDCFVMMESDPGPDEKLMNGECVGGSDFNPSKPVTHRVMTSSIGRAALTADPDLNDPQGREELYAVVHLRHLNAPSTPIAKGKSGILSVKTDVTP